MKRIWVTSLMLATGGCVTVGADYLAPEVSGAQSYAAEPAGVDSAAVETRWWQRFGDSELDRLIAHALASNLDAKFAIARLEEARALARAERAERWPRGGVDAAYQRRRFAEIERFGSPVVEGDVVSVGAEASWEIDFFGRVRRSVEAAEAEVGGRAALLRAVRAAVAADVANRYFELRGAEAALAVARASIENQRRAFAVTQDLAAAGAGSRLDVVRAEAQLRAVEASVPEFERRIAAARHALALLLGQPPQGFDGPGGATSDLAQVTGLTVGSPADLLRRRPDIQAAERALAASNARAGAARAELFPRVQLSGVIGLLGGSVDALTKAGALAFSAGPSLEWGVFDLPRLMAQVGAADARTDAALVNYHRTVLEALGEVEDALVRYGAVRQQLAMLAEQTEASREAARLAGIGFREGEGQFLDVLDAERTLVEAEAALIDARAQHLLSVVDIYRALGGGWEVCDTRGDVDCATSAEVVAAERSSASLHRR